MKKVELAIQHVLKMEGGLVDNPNDPGGITNYGISLRYLKTLPSKEADINNDGKVNAEDIKKMTVAQAKKFYFNNWWKKYDYGRINNEGLSIKVMDMSVNMGGKQAHKLVQRSLRAVGVTVKDDGVLGPVSIEAINASRPQFLIPAIRCTQAGFYYALVMRNNALRKAGVKHKSGKDYEDFSVFLKGWLNRAYS